MSPKETIGGTLPRQRSRRRRRQPPRKVAVFRHRRRRRRRGGGRDGGGPRSRWRARPHRIPSGVVGGVAAPPRLCHGASTSPRAGRGRAAASAPLRPPPAAAVRECVAANGGSVAGTAAAVVVAVAPLPPATRPPHRAAAMRGAGTVGGGGGGDTRRLRRWRPPPPPVAPPVCVVTCLTDLGGFSGARPVPEVRGSALSVAVCCISRLLDQSACVRVSLGFFFVSVVHAPRLLAAFALFYYVQPVVEEHEPSTAQWSTKLFRAFVPSEHGRTLCTHGTIVFARTVGGSTGRHIREAVPHPRRPCRRRVSPTPYIRHCLFGHPFHEAIRRSSALVPRGGPPSAACR